MKKWIYRYVFFILGVAINSFGIAFVTKSAMGTSQISSIPYVFSLEFPSISFGMWTFLFNILFILLQVVLLKKDFHPIQFFQILVNVLFSGLIDLSMSALSFFLFPARGIVAPYPEPVVWMFDFGTGDLYRSGARRTCSPWGRNRSRACPNNKN